jgi:hypothetical protein
MDRAMLERHLALARNHIARGEDALAQQRHVLAELEEDGHDTAAAEARRLLEQFEQLQVLHIADHNRILRELANAENKTAL